jgi:hypothetical protein
VVDFVGIRVRPVKGLDAVMYLDPGALTSSLSYVFGPLVEALQTIGYNDSTLRAAPVWLICLASIDIGVLISLSLSLSLTILIAATDA